MKTVKDVFENAAAVTEKEIEKIVSDKNQLRAFLKDELGNLKESSELVDKESLTNAFENDLQSFIENWSVENISSADNNCRDVFSFIGSESRTSIITKTEGENKTLNSALKTIESNIFTFADMPLIDDSYIEMLLKKIRQKKLLLALQKSRPEVIEKFNKNMEKGKAEKFMKKLNAQKPADPKKILEAQYEIIQLIRHFEDNNSIIID